MPSSGYIKLRITIRYEKGANLRITVPPRNYLYMRIVPIGAFKEGKAH
jgi:hypothetical protein